MRRNLPRGRGFSNPATPKIHHDGFVDFFYSRTLDEQIAFVKAVEPGRTPLQIANICGVSERTVIRSPAYRRLREVFSDPSTPEGCDDGFADFCNSRTLDEQVAFVKAVEPGWTALQIANLCGVSERTVKRSPTYLRLRDIDKARNPAQSKWRGRNRRRIDRLPDGGFSDPDDPLN